MAALLHESEGRHALAARLLGGAVTVARDLGEDPEPIPALATLVGAARQRLGALLGTEYAEQETVGHHTPPAGLLRSAAEGLDPEGVHVSAR